MKPKSSHMDVEGSQLTAGDRVVLLSASADLLRGLPLADRKAIESQVENELSISDFDEYGNAELQFQSSDEILHSIWVNTTNLRKLRLKLSPVAKRNKDHMSHFKRAIYAFGVSVFVLGFFSVLEIFSISLGLSLDLGNLIHEPELFVPLYVVSYLVAPFLAKRIKFHSEHSGSE